MYGGGDCDRFAVTDYGVVSWKQGNLGFECDVDVHPHQIKMYGWIAAKGSLSNHALTRAQAFLAPMAEIAYTAEVRSLKKEHQVGLHRRISLTVTEAPDRSTLRWT